MARYPIAQYKKLHERRIIKLVQQLEQSQDCGVDCLCSGIAEKLCTFLIELFEISDPRIGTVKAFSLRIS